MAFVRAWQKLSTFRGESKFGTWLHRVAVNVILGRRARSRWNASAGRSGEDVIETLPARPAATEHRMDFDAAIGKLPGGARQIFVLHDVEGFKHEGDRPKLLSINIRHFKAQLHRARMLLRGHLAR